MPDIEQIGVDLNIAYSKGAAALAGYNQWNSGKAGTITLTTGQKNTLKTEFIANITAVRDAAQAVIDDIST